MRVAIGAALTALDIPSYVIADTLEDLPETVRHFVWRDADLDRTT